MQTGLTEQSLRLLTAPSPNDHLPAPHSEVASVRLLKTTPQHTEEETGICILKESSELKSKRTAAQDTAWLSDS